MQTDQEVAADNRLEGVLEIRCPVDLCASGEELGERAGPDGVDYRAVVIGSSTGSGPGLTASGESHPPPNHKNPQQLVTTNRTGWHG